MVGGPAPYFLNSNPVNRMGAGPAFWVELGGTAVRPEASTALAMMERNGGSYCTCVCVYIYIWAM